MRETVKSEMPVQRLRLVFSMDPMLRFISHLDLAKAWERTFRRADLPMAFSQGFHPQPKMQFAAALPVGVQGVAELLDLWLVERLSPDTFKNRVVPVLPPGLHLVDVREVPLKAPALLAALLSGEYEACFENVTLGDLQAAVTDFLARERVIVTRQSKKRAKDVDIRPLVESLDAVESEGRACLRMVLSHRAGASVRAFDVIAALGYDVFDARVVRKGLVVG
jgi:radical SAM-linked protein